MSTKSIQSNTRKVPELRFPGFKGEWKEKRLGEVANIIGGGTPDTTNNEYWKGKINWFTPTEIKQKYAKESIRKISDSGLKNSSAKILPIGTILLTSRATVGDVSISKIECATNQGFQSLVVNSENSNEFLYYWIVKNKNEFLRKANGSTFLEVSSKEVRKMKSFLPSLLEQQRISDFLKKTDDYTQNLQSQKELLETYKKGMMQKIFSQEIRFKDDKGREFPKWQETKLGEVAEIVGGGTPDTTKNEYWNGQINWFTPTEISKKYATVSLRKISEFGLKNSSTRLLPIGTLLFTSRATVGDISISTIECCTNQGFQSFVINDQNYNIFFYYLILHYKNEFLRRANGSTFLEISGKEIRKIKVSSPSFSEQRKIGGFLSSLDDVIESMQQQIYLVEQWKRSLMQRLFV